MAVSVSTVQTPRVAYPFHTVTEVTLDNSYLEGGEALTAAQLGLAAVDYAVCHVVNGTEEATVRVANAFYTPATAKIHAIDNATGKECAKEKDLSKVKVLIIAWGKSRAK